ncbi:hypothetical protein BFJ70_g15355 [Fusarium oxysporum]|nr:hypothetical protein FPRO04_12219 [Fusarium proliferatum]RKL15631.1 hypothetical protein BFJ70_g15355 [Fusarium oxysporum]
MEEDALPPYEPVTCAEQRTVKVVPHPVQQYDLFQLPKYNKTWHAHIIRCDETGSEFPAWKMPSVYTVGSLPDSHCVVVVTSRIRQKFNEIYRQYILREVEAGDDVFLDIFTPNNKNIEKYGLEAAKRKTRSDVLGRAVEGVATTGLALYRYYMKIIPVNSDRLPLEWALLGYHLGVSEPEVRDQFTLLSLLLELHFVQDLNSDDVSQLLEKKGQDGWEKYLEMRASLATENIVENTDEEMHEILLVRGLLEFAGHQARVLYYQHDPEGTPQDQERTITDSCRILGRALRCVFEAKDEGESERSNRMHGRMQIPRPLGAHEVRERLIQSGYSNIEISELCVNLPIFLPIGIPVPYRETLPATLVNGLKRKVVMDAITVISDTYMLHFPALRGEENHIMMFLLYLVKNGLEPEVTTAWMNSTEGQSIYDRTLTRMREQPQSLEQSILCLNTLRAYLYLLDPPEPAIEPVYACYLCDFTYLLHGDTQINRRSVLEVVAGSAQKTLIRLPPGVAQIAMPITRPPPVHWCDGFVDRYWQHRSNEAMTHEEAYRRTVVSVATYPAMPQKEQQITPELVSWLVDLRPGQVQDIGGDVTTQHIQEELKNSMYLGNYLGKEVCYIGSSWPGGGTSSQSTGKELSWENTPLSWLNSFAYYMNSSYSTLALGTL